MMTWAIPSKSQRNRERRSPPEFAAVAKLLTTNSPKLRIIIPSHIRPDAPIVTDAKRELDKLGLGGMMFVPELRKAYEY